MLFRLASEALGTSVLVVFAYKPLCSLPSVVDVCLFSCGYLLFSVLSCPAAFSDCTLSSRWSRTSIPSSLRDALSWTRCCLAPVSFLLGSIHRKILAVKNTSLVMIWIWSNVEARGLKGMGLNEERGRTGKWSKVTKAFSNCDSN